MTESYLEFIWFSIFVILLTGYAVLDGFDLGVGILHLFSKKDHERRLMLNSIGPVWDGNEVWLVTAGGALFAGFPIVYATLCTAFYLPLMALLASLIFRAVAIEFRSKQPMAWWRWTWDLLFALASFLIAFILGVAMGNLIRGIPLNSDQEFIGDLDHLIDPYSLLIGIFTVSLFALHGLIFILLKTEGELHDKMRSWTIPCMVFFIMCYAITTLTTLIFMPHMAQAVKERPYIFGVALLNLFAIANIPREINAGRDGRAFVSSCVNIICLMTLYALSTYPNVVRAINGPEEYSITIFNSASSLLTLKILLLIALIGIPLVLGYTAMIYYIFHGKVKLDSNSY